MHLHICLMNSGTLGQVLGVLLLGGSQESYKVAVGNLEVGLTPDTRFITV